MTHPPLPRTPRPANQPQPQPPTPMSPPPVPRTPVPNNPNINSRDDDDERGRYGALADSPLGTQSASVQLLSESPLLLVFDHFLSPTECDDLMEGPSIHTRIRSTRLKALLR